jgi:hypothetical protein
MDRLATRTGALAFCTCTLALANLTFADSRCPPSRPQSIRLNGELAIPLTDMALKNKIASMMMTEFMTACAVASAPMPGIFSVEVKLSDEEKKRLGEISSVSIQTVWALDDYDEMTDVKLHPIVVPFRNGMLGMARSSNELGMKPFKPGRYIVNVNVFGAITRSNQTIYFTVSPTSQ